MMRRPPRSTRTDTLLPYTTLFRSLAPTTPGLDGDLVMRNLEKAEDIPRDVPQAGIPEWTWETYGEFRDTLTRVPKAINYHGYVGHSAIRTWVMGERAFTEKASEADLERMKDGLREALRSGALGFSTTDRKRTRLNSSH